MNELKKIIDSFNTEKHWFFVLLKLIFRKFLAKQKYVLLAKNISLHKQFRVEMPL